MPPTSLNSPGQTPFWWSDRSLRLSLGVAFFLRLAPMVIWAEKTCVRDECSYQKMADALLAGRGIEDVSGWLWAPAYPVMLAVMELLTGYKGGIQPVQLLATVLTQILLIGLGRQIYNDRAARGISWLYALNPTFIFYTSSYWSETIYTLMLVGAVWMLGRARGDLRFSWWGVEEAPRAGALMAGLLVGACVLFRGVATYILPIFLLGLWWGRPFAAVRQQLVACCIAAVLVVAPYSLYATQKFGEPVISDRTLGQMMWLGNNTFEPVSFDWGHGILTEEEYKALDLIGRRHCDIRNPAVKDRCETEGGLRWIKENPMEFFQRVPLRVAQMLTPHSFLTRHLRWGRWDGLPDLVREGMILAVPFFTFSTLIGGSIGFFGSLGRRSLGEKDSRSIGTSWYPFVAGMIVLYHVAAIAVLAGVSRYRVPLEPLWLVFLGGLWADPRGTLEQISSSNLRYGLWLATVGVLLLLMLRFLPAGWSWWLSW